MADQDTKMVLRTVYLPPELDDQLRVQAFRSKKTKNDLIREAVARWFSDDGRAAVQPPDKPKTKASRGAKPVRPAGLRARKTEAET